MDVLSLFTIQGVLGPPDRAQLSLAYIPVKTYNVIRAAKLPDPGIIRPDIPDNVAIAGPLGDYDFYV